MLLSIPKASFTFLYMLLFLYFFTEHADQLSLSFAGFSFRLNNVIALFFLAFFLARLRKGLFAFDKKLVHALLVVTSSIALSLFFSPYKARCFVFFGWYGFTVCCYLLLPYLLVFHLPQEKLFKLYFFSFLCVGFYGTLQFFLPLAGIKDPFSSQEIFARWARPNAFAYEPSYYALYMTPFVILANGAFLIGKLKKRYFVLSNLFFIFSTSTSAFFAYLVFAICLPFFRLVSLRQLAKCVGVFALSTTGLVLLFPQMARQYFLKFFYGDFQSHHSFFERWVGIVNCWKLFLAHPLLGVGLGGVPASLNEAWANGDARYNFEIQEKALTGSLKLFEPSNVFMELLASLGLVGMLAVGFFLFVYLRSAQKALRRAREEEKKWIGITLLSMLVVVVVLQFNQGLLRTYIWTHFALSYAYFQTVGYSELKLSSNHAYVSARPVSSGREV